MAGGMTALLLLSVALGAPPRVTPLEKLQALTKTSRPTASSLMELENDQLRSMHGQLDGQLEHLKQFTKTMTKRDSTHSRRRPFAMGIEKLEAPPAIKFDLVHPDVKGALPLGGVESLVEKETKNEEKLTKPVESLAEKEAAKVEQPTGGQIGHAKLAEAAKLQERELALANEMRYVKPPEITAIRAPPAPYLVPLGTDLGALPQQRSATGWAVPLALAVVLADQ